MQQVTVNPVVKAASLGEASLTLLSLKVDHLGFAAERDGIYPQVR
jgi:hypothetical protein